MRNSIKILLGELDAKLTGHAGLLNYRYMNLCIKAEPAALLSLTVTDIEGNVYNIEEVADTMIPDDFSFEFVPRDMEMGQLVHVISRSHTIYVPVTDDAGALLGEIDITKLRHVLFRTELYHRFKVYQLMTPPPAVLSVGDPMEDVMAAFDRTSAIFLPVVDIDNHLVGYISRSRLFTTYRQMVADFSAE